MLKIAAITFHGAHNYGSMLQTYALQTFVEKLAKEEEKEISYDILNFRTEFQKNLYKPKAIRSIKDLIKKFMTLPYSKKLNNQNLAFEAFLKSNLHTTREVNTLEELRVLAKNYDVIISGSDQIWNIRARDFSFAYLLDGVDCKKISYAASLGPLDIDWSKYDAERYTELLKDYSAISLREQRSKDMVDSLLGTKESEIHVDPTLLLSMDEWRKLQNETKEKQGEYILFYCLEPQKNHLRIAKQLSKKMGMPVVATKYRNKTDYFNSFIKRYDAGPKDFLSLIDNAAAVVTSSFHGTVFSLIYGKPFVCIDGLDDGRISTLLNITGAVNNAISQDALDIHVPTVPDREKVIKAINSERKRSIEYLKKEIGF